MYIVRINLLNFTLFSVFLLISTLYSVINIIFFPLVFILFFLLCSSSVKLKINIPILFLILFMIFTCMSLIWTINFYNSLVQTFFIFFIFLSILVFYWFIKEDNSKIEKFIFYIILASFVINIRNLIFLFLGGLDFVRFGGISEQSNALALLSSTLCVVSVTYLYVYKSDFFKRNIAYLSLFISLFFLVISGSRGGVVSFAIFLLVLYFSKFSNFLNLKFLATTFLLFLIFVFNFNYISQLPFFQRLLLLPQALGFEFFDYEYDAALRMAADDTRINLADIALAKFFENPLLGYGIYSFGYFSEFSYTHNNFLEIIFSLGLFGVSLFYFPFFYIFIKTFLIKNVFLNKHIMILRALIVYYFVSGMSLPNFSSKIQLFVVVIIFSYYSILNFHRNINLRHI